jgi:cytochrome b subunit of formate dehydrogenase
MSNKVWLNYALDAVIALAFILASISGLVFLFAGSGGYQGGRNPDFQTEVLGISRWTWSDLHTWTGLVMIAGVMIHLLLHWKWIVCVTKRLRQPVRHQTQDSCPVT